MNDRHSACHCDGVELNSALIAAVAGGLAAVAVQLLQRRYTDRHRFTSLKRARYSTFLEQMDQQQRQIRHQHRERDRLGRDVRKDDRLPEIDRPEGLKLLAQEIRLLAPTNTGIADAASKCVDALTNVRRYRFDNTKSPPLFLHEAESFDGYEADVAELQRSLMDFVDRAKKDLGSD